MKSYFDGRQWHAKTRAGTLSAPTPAELSAKFEAVRQRASVIAGRPVTDAEVEHGIPKPPLTAGEQSAIRRKRALAQAAERMAADVVSPEAARLAAAKSRANEERRTGLTTAQRELEDAQAAASQAEQRKADEAARAEIMAGKSYQSLRARLDDLLFTASFDPGVSAAELESLTSQSEQLIETLDIGAVRANVSQLQSVIQGRLDLEAANLRAASDAIEQRRKMLGTGTVWDSVDTELVGDLPFIVLTVGAETRKVSQERYDTRASDEALKVELFGDQPNV